MRTVLSALFLASLVGVTSVSAHVIVTPAQVGIAATQLFDVSVPSEKAGVATIALRLVIPDGVTNVLPTVAQGWSIATQKNTAGEVTEIDWSGAAIPTDQREDFTFEAQVPANTGTLQWKAYQTYSDGNFTSWDQAPVAGKEEDDSLTPYSTTSVVNDLNPSAPVERDTTARVFALTALALAVLALIVFPRMRKER